jgi:alpha-ketoglutarate-dependent taurine dioxygenase
LHSYFRLQVFHCLHHDGEGGETLLVDGFRAAYKLKQTYPESFQRLSTLPIEAEYLEAGKHYFSIDSVLKLHPLTKKLQQIRYRRHIM